MPSGKVMRSRRPTSSITSSGRIALAFACASLTFLMLPVNARATLPGPVSLTEPSKLPAIASSAFCSVAARGSS